MESWERSLTCTCTFIYCFFKFLARVNPRINSLTFKTENTKTLTYNFSFLIVWTSGLDINLICLWHFYSSIFHSSPFLNRIYIQHHLINVRFVRSLVTRHLIWDGVLETSRFLVQFKTDQRFLNAKVDLFSLISSSKRVR